MSFKPYVWVLAVAVGTAVTGGTARGVESPATNSQGQHKEYSKNKTYQLQLRAGLADPAHQGYINKKKDQKSYEEVAWLQGQMNDPANAASVSNINDAIWVLLTPDSIGSFQSEMKSAVKDSPGWWLAQAQDHTFREGQVSSAGDFGLFSGKRPRSDDQRVVSTPESPTLILLGADLLGLAALTFLFRRRIIQRHA
jgi:hypothetical protein